jgi:hypothetical protein
MNINRIQSVQFDDISGYIITPVGGGGKIGVPDDARNKEYRLVQRWIAAGNTVDPSDEDSMSLADYKARARHNQKLNGKMKRQDNEFDTTDSEAYKINLKAYFVSNVKTPINAAVDRAGVDAAVALVDWDSVVIP